MAFVFLEWNCTSILITDPFFFVPRATLSDLLNESAALRKRHSILTWTCCYECRQEMMCRQCESRQKNQHALCFVIGLVPISPIWIFPAFRTERWNAEENGLAPGSEAASILHGAGGLLPRLLQYYPPDFECRPAGERPGSQVREDPALLSFPVSTLRLPNMTMPISTTPTTLPFNARIHRQRLLPPAVTNSLLPTHFSFRVL